jgi:sugar lactone lactonase YvrE
MIKRKILCAVFVGALLPALAAGVETTFWQVGTFDEFMQGTLRDVSLSKEGELTLAPESSAVFAPEEALALSLASDPKGNLYIGTGHQGKVFRVAPDQKGSLFFTAEESDVFALAAGPDGALYVGTSPEGKIYRVTADGNSNVFFEPKTKYIWALEFDRQGRLYASTGDQGKIFRIDAKGKGDVFFDSKQTHIMCLTFDREGNLLAGSVPNGLVFRITPEGRGFVLHQAGFPEIRDIAVAPDGRIYAAALGAAGGRATPDFFTPQPVGQQQTPTVTVTVTAGTGDVVAQGAAQQQPPPTQPPGATTPSLGRQAASPTAPMPYPPLPQGRGSLIQINPDYTVETLWSSNNESVFGLAIEGDRVVFSTDSNGRIFDLTPTPDGPKLTLLTQTQEALATRLLAKGDNLYVATSNIAKLFRVGGKAAAEGTFESAVRDAKFVSRWGTLSWRGVAPAGAQVAFYTRSGNSERPDSTWSDWAGPYTEFNGNAVQSPPARYLQWKAMLRAKGQAAPILQEVTVSYLNQNLPPQIRSLNVSTSSERTSPSSPPASPGPQGQGATVSAAPTVTYTSVVTSAGGSRPATPTVLSWQADDPNGDTLQYSIYVRAADETEWHLLREKHRQPNYLIEPSSLADGKYLARVVASDELSNSPELARRGEMVSAPFWIDNTPPVLQVVQQAVSAEGAIVQFRVEDATSPLRQAEVSIGTGEWQDVNADDGIVDSRVETFTVRLNNLEPGEHVVTLRAYDTAGNAGVGKAVLRVGAPAVREPRR